MTARRAPTAPLIIRADPWSVGPWLGWLTILAVLVAIATERAGPREPAIVVLMLLGAAANVGTYLVPRRLRVFHDLRGRMLLDIWCAGVVAFCGMLVIIGGTTSDLEWVFTIAIPFVVIAHQGWRRKLWFVVALGTFALALLTGPDPYPPSAVAFRIVLVFATAVLVLVLGEAVAYEAQARSQAATRAQLERTLVAEAHHRVKNSLQQVAELLVLSRPDDASGAAFDETSARIRAIAAVHAVLEGTEGTDAPADAVVRQVVAGVDPAIVVTSQPIRVPAATAQQLGIVANELASNAKRHGAPPIAVALSANGPLRLEIVDHGSGYDPAAARLGLRLVRQIVEQGLRGSLEVLHEGDATVTRVEFTIPKETPV